MNIPATVRECLRQLHNGALSSEDIVRQCLDTIEKTDSSIGAWAHVDENYALEQARAMDLRRKQGRSLGALHGIPVGIKDIVDTRELPTERGSVIYANRQPDSNAAIINKLGEAGAVVLGKTVTTELAWMHESHTRNPHNTDYSPGGSSSGSAAAVAAGHVPLAIGSQTGGSVIRPASFTGVYGYKPSRGVIPRQGVLRTSETLDQIGIFGRDAGDISLLCDVIKGYDPSDSQSRLAPRPDVLNGYLSDVPIEPSLAWIDMPYKDRYSQGVIEGFDELTQVIRDGAATLDRIPAPQSFIALIKCHQAIYDYEILRNLENEWTNHRSELSDTAQAGLKRAESRSDQEYAEALEIMQASQDWFSTFFHDYDAIVTPSAVDIAPRLGNGTGDPVCCAIWTLCGLPCVSLPLLSGEQGLPLGVQLVGSHDYDDRLLRTTRWLINDLTNDSSSEEESR